MPVPLPELKAYLASAAMPGSFTDDELERVLLTEDVAQRNVLGAGDQARGAATQAAHPEDLGMALCRRVARSLAARVLPLGYELGETTSVYTSTVGRDPEIARLENPYTPLVFG